MNNKKMMMLIIASFFILCILAFAADDEDNDEPENPFGNIPSNTNNPFTERSRDETPAMPPSADQPLTIPAPKTPMGNPGFTISGGNSLGGFGGMKEATDKDKKPAVHFANENEIVEDFNYPDAEILDVAKAIAKLTGRNFIYNPQDIKGKISVVSESPITIRDAWYAFLSALDLKNFTVIPAGKYLRIQRSVQAREKQTPIFTGDKSPNNDQYITRIITLKYIDSKEIERTFRSWVSNDARMQSHDQTNTLIITDTANHINSLYEIIKVLDVKGFQESLAVIPIRNATATDIAKLIEEILGNSSGSSSSGGINPIDNRPRPISRFGDTSTKGGGSSISKIIADDRTNSLIVKANSAGVEEVQALVKKLDTPIPAPTGTGRLHLVRLQFADAESVAKALTGITDDKNKDQRRFLPPDVSGAVFAGEVKVNPDKDTQSLVITASPQDFATLKKVISKLDIPRDQVFVEAIITEVSVSNNNGFGTSFVNAVNGITFASSNLGALLTKDASALSNMGLGIGFKAGHDYNTLTTDSSKGTQTNINNLFGLFQLLQGTSTLNVLATPKIIALDNKEADIEISETSPRENISVTTTGQTTTFTDDKAELSLKVTPHINRASNFVRLDIKQKIENFDPTNVPQAIRDKVTGKSSRSTDTAVMVQDGDTVVLSGLIRDSVNETVKKVPLLGDIPILGWLFKQSSKTAQKTNLLVFITPTIIKQYDKVRKILENKLKEREEFVTDEVGTIDPQQKTMDRLKKNLPDLRTIEPYPSQQDLESSSYPLPAANDDEEVAPRRQRMQQQPVAPQQQPVVYPQTYQFVPYAAPQAPQPQVQQQPQVAVPTTTTDQTTTPTQPAPSAVITPAPNP